MNSHFTTQHKEIYSKTLAIHTDTPYIKQKNHLNTISCIKNMECQNVFIDCFHCIWNHSVIGLKNIQDYYKPQINTQKGD